MAPRNDNALPEGSILRHGEVEYYIERFLGAGGFGMTYLVTRKAMMEGNKVSVRCCVKEHFLSQDCWRDQSTNTVNWSKPAEDRVAESKKDFISEAKRLQKKIQHSHIVRVNDVFEANDTAYYVMEFLDGKSLRNYIRKQGACKEDEAISLLLPIIRAIGYLHDQRITHLDVKPDNIMIVESNGKIVPKLIDFGLSKHYDRKGKPTSTMRVQATSDGYSPIEQYQGIESFQPAADIYALASTFVFCITGRDPKKSADLRPGETRKLLEDKISTRSLNAILNALRPSQYERTQNIKRLLEELCPEEDSENWEIETDNNITDPLFFKKKRRSETVFSRLRTMIDGMRNKPKELAIPDVSLYIRIKRPKIYGFSKEVWLCKSVCNTIYTYDGDERIDDIDFAGGMNDEINTYLKNSGLLEDRHWENDSSVKEHGDMSVAVIFHYSDGKKYSRIQKGISVHHRLYVIAEGLLNCSSIRRYVYDYEARRDSHSSEENSSMLAYNKGMLKSIRLDQWRQLSQVERETFDPFIINLFIDGERISLFVEEKKDVRREEVESVLEYFQRQLCPSGIPGYETGECRLLKRQELFLLASHRNIFEEWGIDRIRTNQWVCDEGWICLFSAITGSSGQIGSVRPVVNYYGTVVPYTAVKG